MVGARFSVSPDASLTREELDESLRLGRAFMLANQRQAGNFAYMYDFVVQRDIAGDSAVRQAGALWAVALMHHDSPTQETATALERGFGFFRRISMAGQDGLPVPVYPGSLAADTGTVALLTLAYIDALRADAGLLPREQLKKELHGYLATLLAARREDGRFHRGIDPTGDGFGGPSPYYDGESLLAMVKAARYAGRDDLKPLALASAEAMHRACVTRALRRDPDSDVTKGYYQWGSMAYFEIAAAGWKGGDRFADRAIDLAYWMIDVHRTLHRTRNTGYAYEGLICAYRLAQLRGRDQAARKIRAVIEQGLAKLTSWQIAGTRPNAFLREHPTEAPRAVGGVMNGQADPYLRVDVTQHQMHAVILARRYVYRKDTPSP